MKQTALLAMLLALTTSQADAFSSPGHQAIADVAQDRLSPATRSALGRILQDSNDLASGALATVATWPDDVRARAAHGTIAAGWTADDVQEADDFNRDQPRNGEWHFVNLPLGAAGYPADPVAPGDPLRAFVYLARVDVQTVANRGVAGIPQASSSAAAGHAIAVLSDSTVTPDRGPRLVSARHAAVVQPLAEGLAGPPTRYARPAMMRGAWGVGPLHERCSMCLSRLWPCGCDILCPCDF